MMTSDEKSCDNCTYFRDFPFERCESPRICVNLSEWMSPVEDMVARLDRVEDRLSCIEECLMRIINKLSEDE